MFVGGVIQVANQALDALKRMKAGMVADKAVDRKRARKEVCNLFHSKKKKVQSASKAAWRHKFVCLAYKDQARIPASDIDKEELYQAGLGEKEICFPSLNLTPEEFKELLYDQFPPLREGGGYQLLKCLPNSRVMEVLSPNVHASPALLKQRVGTSRTYIRPLQKDLDLTETVAETAPETVSYYSCRVFFNSLCNFAAYGEVPYL